MKESLNFRQIAYKILRELRRRGIPFQWKQSPYSQSRYLYLDWPGSELWFEVRFSDHPAEFFGSIAIFCGDDHKRLLKDIMRRRCHSAGHEIYSEKRRKMNPRGSFAQQDGGDFDWDF